jgi:ABC-type antimicrobial peptide transport system permease subunit
MFVCAQHLSTAPPSIGTLAVETSVAAAIAAILSIFEGRPRGAAASTLVEVRSTKYVASVDAIVLSAFYSTEIGHSVIASLVVMKLQPSESRSIVRSLVRNTNDNYYAYAG